MSAYDGNNDMEAEFGWSDAQFDAALRGGPDAPDALVSFAATAVIELTDPIDDAVAKHHIATSAAVARSIAHDAARAALAAAATADANPEVGATVTNRKRLRKLTFAGAFSGMWAKIALGTAALAAVGTGAAVTDTLPDPVQAVFSDVAHVVGIEIPHPGDIDPADIDPADIDPADDADATVVPETTSTPPDDRGAADEARDQSDEQQAYNECRKTSAEPDECVEPTPPGLEDKDKATPPGLEDKEDKKTPPGQEDKDGNVPPGQGNEKPGPPDDKAKDK